MAEKRLGRMISCPACYALVNPIVVTEYPENEKVPVPIPARTVLQCPKDNRTVWYIVTEGIEELPLANME
jgi:hypothetical protein